MVSLQRVSRGVATCPSSQRAQGRAGSPLPPSPQRAFSPSYSRIGRKAALLLQLLISAVVGLSTAFVTKFELYMFLRFVVATATSGLSFSIITLRGYLSPEAFSHRLRPWRLATFPRLTGRVGGGGGCLSGILF